MSGPCCWPLRVFDGDFHTEHACLVQARRNAMGVGLVFEADLATTEHPSHWVLQGVALTLNIDQ